jgi:hypothetical protein
MYNTGYTQKNGAVSMVNKGKPHHSFVYALYVRITMWYVHKGYTEKNGEV